MVGGSRRSAAAPVLLSRPPGIQGGLLLHFRSRDRQRTRLLRVASALYLRRMTIPRRVLSPVVVTVVLAYALLGTGFVRDAAAQTTAQRSVEAVVVTGAKLPTWSRLPATVT